MADPPAPDARSERNPLPAHRVLRLLAAGRSARVLLLGGEVLTQCPRGAPLVGAGTGAEGPEGLGSRSPWTCALCLRTKTLHSDVTSWEAQGARVSRVTFDTGVPPLPSHPTLEVSKPGPWVPVPEGLGPRSPSSSAGSP